jgi:hypothetical protein
MPTLPLRSGGTTVTFQTATESPYGDRVYVDRITITGCLMFPGFSTTGRISTRSESTAAAPTWSPTCAPSTRPTAPMCAPLTGR